MKPNLFVKITTLTAFTVLLSGLVAYKAGAFESYLAETQIDSLDSPKSDSIQPQPRLMAPSSKSDVIFEPIEEEKQKDSAATQKNSQQQNNNTNQREQTPNQNNKPKTPVYMGSSKSAPVFTPTNDTSKPK